MWEDLPKTLLPVLNLGKKFIEDSMIIFSQNKSYGTDNASLSTMAVKNSKPELEVNHRHL